VERRRQGEDRASMLDGDNPAGGEGAAVANAVDCVDNRNGGIAGAQEIRMQGVDRALFGYRSPGRDESLTGDLTSEYALQVLIGLLPRNRSTSRRSRSRMSVNSSAGWD
jgi:hypothetical protein